MSGMFRVRVRNGDGGTRSSTRNYRVGWSADDMFIPSSLSTTDSPSLPPVHRKGNSGLSSSSPSSSLQQGSSKDVLANLMNAILQVQQAKHESSVGFLMEVNRRKELEKQVSDKDQQLAKAREEIADLQLAITKYKFEVFALNRRFHREQQKTNHQRNMVKDEVGEIIQMFGQLQEKRKLRGAGSIATVISSADKASQTIDVSSSIQLQANQPTASSLTASSTVETTTDVGKHGVDRARAQEGFYCLCGISLSKNSNLYAHIRRYDPANMHFECSDCGKKFFRTRELKNHMRSAHNLIYKLFGCRVCGSTFKTGLQLSRHLRNKHNTMTKPAPRRRLQQVRQKFCFKTKHSKVRSEDASKHQCLCGQAYSNRKSLDTHIRRNRIAEMGSLRKGKHVGCSKDKASPVSQHHSKNPVDYQFQKHASASSHSSRDRVRCKCGERFESRRELVKHVKRYEETNRELQPDEIKCSWC